MVVVDVVQGDVVDGVNAVDVVMVDTVDVVDAVEVVARTDVDVDVVVVVVGSGGSGSTAGTAITGNVAKPTSNRGPITSPIMPGRCRNDAACPSVLPVTLGRAACCPSSSMEEQRTFNPLVQGSSPWGGTR